VKNNKLDVMVAGRVVLLILVYGSVLVISLFLALLFRFDFVVPFQYLASFTSTIIWFIPLKLIALAFFGQYRTLLTYFSLPDAKRIASAMGVSSLIAIVVWYILGGSGVVPRGVIVSDLLISFIGIASLRTVMRLYREHMIGLELGASSLKKKRTVVVGAGASGAALLRDIQQRRGIGLEVVCFIDDDPQKIGSNLHGKPVLGPIMQLGLVVEDLNLQKAIIAMPSAKTGVIKRLVEQINSIGIDHDILPSVSQLLHRQVTVNHLRRVDPEDLLGRETVALDHGGIEKLIKGRAVLVTGAGGSIGSELCRQIAGQNPSKLVLVERSEPALFAIEQELISAYRHVELVPCVSSVCDEDAMGRIFSSQLPSLVFHAAAHKHVPLMESQASEALRNNSIGTEIVARMAAQNGVKKFILVSTDKAVNPTNVMGATKRLAEMLIDEKQQLGSQCLYAAVRFGNVLGSSGSVIPTFRRQIAEGGPVTVTHPEVTRFFMSIPEAVGLILQCALQAHGGEIFVLDMGQPIKISDMARQMIELSGFIPDEDIQISYTGLRPGEKLYEEPIHEMENIETTIHSKVRLLRNNRAKTLGLTEELLAVYHDKAGNPAHLKQWLSAKIPEYRPAVR
jgi:FlaA1/EpsC-like NDP-sugar epimerase